mgnify:CR=1 FL=1
MIQPLVVNSLIHAFPGNSGHDRIDVRIHMENDMLIIEVSDNGKGMPEELINKINSYDHRTDSVKTSIGIYNVISRIKMYYGDESVFLIEKNEPEGTKIVITIDVNGGKGSL